MKKRTDYRNDQRNKTKNPTTNYSMDNHKYFCKRCFRYHGCVCPITKTNIVSKSCSL